MTDVLFAAQRGADSSRADLLDTLRLRLSVATDLAPLVYEWRELESRSDISPYQSYDFVAAWARHAAAADDLAVRVGIVRDEWGRLAAILPFGVMAGPLFTTAHYLGGRHSNINMPLVSKRHRDRFGPEAVEALLTLYGEMVGADLLVLANQPERWAGTLHVFTALPRQPSVDVVRGIVTDGDYEALVGKVLSRSARSRLRRREKKLAAEGVRRPRRAASPREVERALDAFLSQKGRQLAELGVRNPFDAPGVRAFLLEAGLAGLDGDGLVLDTLDCADKVLAVRGELRRGGHASLLVLSFDKDHPLASSGPGEVLFAGALARDIAEGVREVDFGCGDARYKESWGNQVIPMFDAMLPFTASGRACAAGERARRASIRGIKKSKTLYSALKFMRAVIGRARGGDGIPRAE